MDITFKLDQIASATSSNNGYYLDEFSYHNSKLTQAEIQATKSSPDYTTNIDGMIDEFFIDSSALTSTEIDHIYDRGDKGTLVTTTSASTTEYDDSSVVGGNTYYFSVAGVNAIGEGVAITPYVSGLAGPR